MFDTYTDFQRHITLTQAEICHELFEAYPAMIRIKKPRVAVPNLVRIMDATLALGNAQGFHAMSLRALCAESGMSMGGLYAYIRNKDDLLVLIQGHGLRLVRRIVAQAVASAPTPRAQLAAAVRGHLFLTEALRAWFYFAFMEAKRLPEDLRAEALAAEQAVEQTLRGLLDAVVAEGVVSAPHTGLLAGALKAMLQEWYLKRGKYRRMAVSVDEYAAFVLDVIEARLVAQPHAG